MFQAALDHFTRLVALELAPKGVRVNTISPGITVSTYVLFILYLFFHQAIADKRKQYVDTTSRLNLTFCTSVLNVANDKIFMINHLSRYIYFKSICQLNLVVLI